MTDKPYNVGFLEEIVNVHFGGGDWISIYAFPAVHSTVSTNSTITAAFPGLIGGTPGVPVLTNNLHPSGFSASPHVLTAADVQHDVVTGSLRKFKSFGIWKREAAPFGDHGTPADEVQCWVQIPAELKASGVPFIMKVYTTISDPNLSSQPLDIATYRESTIKAGYNAANGSSAGSVASVPAGMSPLDAFQQFLIDPRTLSIVWL